MMHIKKKKFSILKEVLSYAFFSALFIFAGVACFKMVNTELDLTILGFLFIVSGIIIAFLIYKITLALVCDTHYLYKINLLQRQKKIGKLSEIEIVSLSDNIKSQRGMLGNLPMGKTMVSVYQIKVSKGFFLIHGNNYNDIEKFVLYLLSQSKIPSALKKMRKS